MSDEPVEVVEDPEEEHEEERLDPELAARRAAAMSFIRRYGDPVLKSLATAVDRFDDSLRNQVSRMAAIMNDALGVGLAAPQVGVSQRLLVYRVGQDAPLIALVNPEIDWTSEDGEEAEEGCLSIPGIGVDVERPVHVRGSARGIGQRHAHRGGRCEHAGAGRQLVAAESEAEAGLADQPRGRLVAGVPLAGDRALVTRTARGARVDLDLVVAALTHLLARS